MRIGFGVDSSAKYKLKTNSKTKKASIRKPFVSAILLSDVHEHVLHVDLVPCMDPQLQRQGTCLGS